MLLYKVDFTYIKSLAVGFLYFLNGVKTITNHLGTLSLKECLLLLETINLRFRIKKGLELSLLVGLSVTKIRVSLSLIAKEPTDTIQTQTSDIIGLSRTKAFRVLQRLRIIDHIREALT